MAARAVTTVAAITGLAVTTRAAITALAVSTARGHAAERERPDTPTGDADRRHARRRTRLASPHARPPRAARGCEYRGVRRARTGRGSGLRHRPPGVADRRRRPRSPLGDAAHRAGQPHAPQTEPDQHLPAP